MLVVDVTIRAPAATAVASAPPPRILVGGGTAMIGGGQDYTVTVGAPEPGWHLPHGHEDLISAGIVFGFAGAAIYVVWRAVWDTARPTFTFLKDI